MMVCEAPATAPFVPQATPRPREETQLALICIIDPHVIERAQRLEFALRHLRAGMPAIDVRAALRRQFGIAQPLAWRIVDMALDLAGPV